MSDPSYSTGRDPDDAEPSPQEDRSASTVEAVAAVIRDRRTSLLVDPDVPIDQELVASLIDAATWAPNHKRTWPWRFTVISGEARSRLGDELASVASAAGQEPARVAKLRIKYRRSPVVVLVWTRVDEDAFRAREDRDATAAAVQNLLLSATANGLGSHWASVPEVLEPAVRQFAGLDDRHHLVALVYLGWPIDSTATPERPDPQVTWLG